MRAQNTVSFANIAATPGKFLLKGGKYGFDCTATFSAGSVNLQKVAADGSTLVTIGSSTNFTVAGYVVVDLPPGQYSLTITTATAVYAQIARIPND